RIITQWRDDTLNRLAALPLEEASFAQLDAFDRALEDVQVSFLPSERLRLSKAVADGRVRVAVPAMNASLDGVLRSANGYDGAVALGVWEGQHAQTLTWVPEATMAQMRARIDGKLDPLLATLMDDELKAIGRFGRGRDAVIAGQKWFVDFKARYAFALARPLVAGAVGRIVEQRQLDLLAAERVLNSEVDSEKTDAGLDRLAAAYLVYPEDGRTAAGGALDRRISDRRAALDTERSIAENFSPNERRLMDGRGAVAVPPGYAGNGSTQLRPSEDDVRIALIRGFVAAGGRRLGPDTVTYGNVLFGGLFDLEIDVKT